MADTDRNDTETTEQETDDDADELGGGEGCLLADFVFWVFGSVLLAGFGLVRFLTN